MRTRSTGVGIAMLVATSCAPSTPAPSRVAPTAPISPPAVARAEPPLPPQPEEQPPPTTPPPKVDEVYLLTLGDLALPIACHDAASHRFIKGPACLEALPDHADLIGVGPPLHGEGRGSFKCPATDEVFTGFRIPPSKERRLLRFPATARRVRILGPAAQRATRIRLGAGKGARLFVDGKAGPFLDTGSGTPELVIRVGEGAVSILGVADATADEEPAFIGHWDFGHGWRSHLVAHVDGQWDFVGEIGCGC